MAQQLQSRERATSPSAEPLYTIKYQSEHNELKICIEE